MGLLDDVMASDAAAFADTDGFGESVVYTPRGGSPLTITAVVYRGDRMPAPGLAAGSVADLIVEVRNSSTLGVAMSSINTGGDTITVAKRLGGTAEAFQIVEILSHDAGMIRVRLA